MIITTAINENHVTALLIRLLVPAVTLVKTLDASVAAVPVKMLALFKVDKATITAKIIIARVRIDKTNPVAISSPRTPLFPIFFNFI